MSLSEYYVVNGHVKQNLVHCKWKYKWKLRYLSDTIDLQRIFL